MVADGRTDAGVACGDDGPTLPRRPADPAA